MKLIISILELNQYKYIDNIMIVGIFFLIAIYWTVASLAAYFSCIKYFNHYKNYPRIEVTQNEKAFVRSDFETWDKKAITRGCFTTFPFHAWCFGTYLIFYGIIATLKKYLKYPDGVINVYRLNVGRIMFKICFTLIQQFDYRQRITTPIVVSNHPCWADFIYQGACLAPLSFVSKKQVVNILVINSIAQYLQVLYVDRADPDSRNSLRKSIAKRVQQFNKNPHDCNPLLIYPEGTTSNARSILQFKAGAFQPLSKITLLSLKYECKQFHMGLDQIDSPEHMLFTLCLKPTLRVRKEVVAPNQDESVQSYKQRCRKRMADTNGFKMYDSGYRDGNQYIRKVRQIASENRKKAKESKRTP